MSTRCRIVVYSIVSLIIAGIAALLVHFLFFSGIFIPTLELVGGDHLQVNMNETYQDPGAKSVYRFMDNSDHLHMESTVDTSRLGTYQVIYTLDNADKQAVRTVEVIDGKAPDLRLKGDAQLKLFIGDQYEEPGYSAYDNCDGDISDRVHTDSRVDFNQAGTYEIIYTVSDSHGNETSLSRSVQILENPLNVKLEYNHDLFDNTSFEWWFDKSQAHARNTAAKSADWLKTYGAYYIGPDEKVIYLTFDEGGNDITYIKQIADVLNEYEVKATFFLTRNYIRDEADFVRDLVKHGHVIGNHSWHHYDMTTLANAQQVDAFVEELTQEEKTYLEVVGEPMPKIFRFPRGGCSERAMKMVCDLGYRTYFWSHAYYDYGSDVSEEEALKTMMDHYHNGAIYLLHPSNKGNWEALDDFIREMKRLGYRFETVDHIG